MRRLEKE